MNFQMTMIQSLVMEEIMNLILLLVIWTFGKFCSSPLIFSFLFLCIVISASFVKSLLLQMRQLS